MKMGRSYGFPTSKNVFYEDKSNKTTLNQFPSANSQEGITY